MVEAIDTRRRGRAAEVPFRQLDSRIPKRYSDELIAVLNSGGKCTVFEHLGCDGLRV